MKQKRSSNVDYCAPIPQMEDIDGSAMRRINLRAASQMERHSLIPCLEIVNGAGDF